MRTIKPRHPTAVRSLAAGLVVALAAASCSALTGGSTYAIEADFSQTIGLYPGSFVRELGIDIGSVTKVVNLGTRVRVTMKISRPHLLPQGAHAILVGNSVLGERYVQFTPAYTGGPSLAPGALVPLSATAVPVETDEVLRSLRDVLTQVDPNNAQAAVSNLASVVNGQGRQLNELLANASGTLDLLATKSADLGQLVTTLSTLTGALRTRTDALAALIRDYDQVSQTIADDRQSVDGTISNLSSAASQTAGLLNTNLPGLRDDVAVITTAAQSLDRNIDSLDRGLVAAPRLFSAAQRAYDPQHNWLPLNTQSSPSTTNAVLAARVRDSLSSLCRRLAVKQPSLAGSLAACGDPNSGFFDPIIGAIPTLLRPVGGPDHPTSGPNAPTPVRPARAVAGAGLEPSGDPAGVLTAIDAFANGIAGIPGLDEAQRSAIAAVGSATMLPASTAPGAAVAPKAGVGVLDAGAALGPRPRVQPAPSGSWWSQLWSWL